MLLFKRLHGHEFDFHPDSFVLLMDRETFVRTAKSEYAVSQSSSSYRHKQPPPPALSKAGFDACLWIVKPVASSCGRGISVVTTEQALHLAGNYKKRRDFYYSAIYLNLI
jgi:formate-dependent phosphoribosylglycinamide formyltransferase (GAR transformylase)